MYIYLTFCKQQVRVLLLNPFDDWNMQIIRTVLKYKKKSRQERKWGDETLHLKKIASINSTKWNASKHNLVISSWPLASSYNRWNVIQLNYSLKKNRERKWRKCTFHAANNNYNTFVFPYGELKCREGLPPQWKHTHTHFCTFRNSCEEEGEPSSNSTH